MILSNCYETHRRDSRDNTIIMDTPILSWTCCLYRSNLLKTITSLHQYLFPILAVAIGSIASSKD